MSNEQIAQAFDELGDLLEIKGDSVFKIRAYHRAAENIRSLAEPVARLVQEDRLDEIPGVGEAIADKIHQLLTTGKIDTLERLRQEVPPSLLELLQIPDLGPRRAGLFWREAGIKDVNSLETALREGRLADLPGIGPKTEQRLLAGIETYRQRSDRLPLAEAWPLAQEWLGWLRSLPQVKRAELAGSLRRHRTTVGDLDFAVASNSPEEIKKAFDAHAGVSRVLGQGENKISVEIGSHTGLQVWIQPSERFGTLWLFTTGSRDHNIHLRQIALQQNLSLSEQALTTDDGKELLCAEEEEVYAKLGMPWIPPEMREDRGEIQAALRKELPRLVEQEDLIADLHSHTTWSDGRNTIEEMARAAIQRGIRILAITDHSAGLGVAGGLTVERLHQQRDEIRKVQEKLGDDLLLLQGSEVEIRTDGSLDFPDEALADLDIVVAALHSGLRQPKQQVTQRLVRAMRNPHVDVIAHPSGRLFPNRPGADLDWDSVLSTAAETGVAMEINAHPLRLDLEDIYARRAAEMGIPICINSDAHSPADFDNLPFGISQAKRAWLRPEQVINTWPAEKLRAWLSARGK